MLKVPLTLLSPGGTRGRLSILIFHRVLPKPDPLAPDEPDAAAFEEQMRWVRTWFNVLPLATAVEMLYAARLPPRALAITFDDGYADNAELAAPILQRLGLTATFFVSTGSLSGGCMWNDRIIEAIRQFSGVRLDLTGIGHGVADLTTPDARRQAIAGLLNGIKHLAPAERLAAVDAVVATAGGGTEPALMMNAAQVQSLIGLGMDVGAHTVSHPILTRLDPASAKQEILQSKGHLEEILGQPVLLFAYPNGVPRQDYVAEHVQMVRDCGFAAAVSTAWGTATPSSDRFQLPRFTPWDRARWRYGARMLWNLKSNAHSVA